MLLTKVGNTGIARRINIDKEFSLFVSVALLKFPQNMIDGEYLEFLLSSPYVKKQSADGTQGIGNKNLVLRTIRSFTVPLPPYDEQRNIIKSAAEMLRLCKNLKDQFATERKVSKKISESIVFCITGTQIEEKEKMKAPKTELVSRLKLNVSPANDA